MPQPGDRVPFRNLHDAPTQPNLRPKRPVGPALPTWANLHRMNRLYGSVVGRTGLELLPRPHVLQRMIAEIRRRLPNPLPDESKGRQNHLKRVAMEPTQRYYHAIAL
jgi:hypothetical protein